MDPVTGFIAEGQHHRPRSAKQTCSGRRSRIRSILRAVILDSDSSDEAQGDDADANRPVERCPGALPAGAVYNRSNSTIPLDFLVPHAGRPPVAPAPAPQPQPLRLPASRISNASFVAETPIAIPLTDCDGVPATPTEELGLVDWKPQAADLALQGAGREPHPHLEEAATHLTSDALQMSMPRLPPAMLGHPWPAPPSQPPHNLYQCPARALERPFTHEERLPIQPPPESNWPSYHHLDQQMSCAPMNFERNDGQPYRHPVCNNAASTAAANVNPGDGIATAATGRGPWRAADPVAAPVGRTNAWARHPPSNNLEPKPGVRDLPRPAPGSSPEHRCTALQPPSTYRSPTAPVGKTAAGSGFASLVRDRSPGATAAGPTANPGASHGPASGPMIEQQQHQHQAGLRNGSDMAADGGASSAFPLPQNPPTRNHYPCLPLQSSKLSPRPAVVAPAAQSGGSTAGDGLVDPHAAAGRQGASCGSDGSGPGADSGRVSRARLNLSDKLHAYSGAAPGRVSSIALPTLDLHSGRREALMAAAAAAAGTGDAAVSCTPLMAPRQYGTSGLGTMVAGGPHVVAMEDYTPTCQGVKGLGHAAAAPPSSAKSTPFDEDMLAALDSLERRFGNLRPPDPNVAGGGATRADEDVAERDGNAWAGHGDARPGEAVQTAPVVTAYELMQQERQQQQEGTAKQPPPPSFPGQGQRWPQAGFAPPQQGQLPPRAPGPNLMPAGSGASEHGPAQPPVQIDVVGQTPEINLKAGPQPGAAVVVRTGPTPDLESGSFLAALDELEDRHRRAEAGAAAAAQAGDAGDPGPGSVGVQGPGAAAGAAAADGPGAAAQGSVRALTRESPLPVKQLAFTPMHGVKHQPHPYQVQSANVAGAGAGARGPCTANLPGLPPRPPLLQPPPDAQQQPHQLPQAALSEHAPERQAQGPSRARDPPPPLETTAMQAFDLPQPPPVQPPDPGPLGPGHQLPGRQAAPAPQPLASSRPAADYQWGAGHGAAAPSDPHGPWEPQHQHASQVGWQHGPGAPPGAQGHGAHVSHLGPVGRPADATGAPAVQLGAAGHHGTKADDEVCQEGGFRINAAGKADPFLRAPAAQTDASARPGNDAVVAGSSTAFATAPPIGAAAQDRLQDGLTGAGAVANGSDVDDGDFDQEAEGYAAPLTQRALAEGNRRRTSGAPAAAAAWGGPCGKTQRAYGNLAASMAAAAGPNVAADGTGAGGDGVEEEAGGGAFGAVVDGAEVAAVFEGEEEAPPVPPRQLEAYLPAPLCEAYYERGGRFELYEWQAECLCQLGVLMGRNLVYCAPTSGGKSMVAEVLGIRRLLTTGKPFMLVLPFVALCAEKADALQALLAPINRVVNSAYGGQHSGKIIQPGVGAIVATIEKANMLVNAMLEEEALEELSAVIVDELHMVGEEERGYLLELLLTKLRFATSASAGGGNEPEEEPFDWTAVGPAYQRDGLQIIGMSATMPNVDVVARWLDAALYTTSFRPVQLQEYVKVGRRILDPSGQLVRELTVDKAWEDRDTDHVALLTAETVRDGHSVLIFCASKLWCEKVAEHVARMVEIEQRERPPATAATSGGGSGPGGAEGGDATSPSRSSRNTFAADLRRLAGADPTLPDLVARGVAYHHAGLSNEERDLVEAAYKAGAVSVLTATSTLAAGVNLPARRVIFRHSYIGRPDNPIDATKYRQMSGRAGRAGIDTAGESYLLCERSKPVANLLALLQQKANPIGSCLTEVKKGMKRAVLEVVASGAVSSGADVKRFIGCTLLHAQNGLPAVAKATIAALHWLKDNGFIRVDETTLNWGPTPFGKATLASSMPPEEALVVRADLERARQSLVLATDLHVTYLVTPIREDLRVDWEIYFDWFEKLSKVDARVAELVGVVPAYLVRLRQGHRGARGAGGAAAAADAEKERVARRFFAAMVLSDLIQEVPLKEVAEKYGLGKERGPLEGLQERAGRFAAMVAAFCERLGWSDLEVIIAKFQSRVWYGVRPEVVALTEIPYVKGHRARLLFKAGLRTPEAVAGCELDRLIEILSAGGQRNPEQEEQQRRTERRAARMILQGAKDLVNQKVQELKEQARALRAALDPGSTQQHSVPLDPSLAPPQPPPQPRPQHGSSGPGPASVPPGPAAAKGGEAGAEAADGSGSAAGIRAGEETAAQAAAMAGDTSQTAPVQAAHGWAEGRSEGGDAGGGNVDGAVGCTTPARAPKHQRLGPSPPGQRPDGSAAPGAAAPPPPGAPHEPQQRPPQQVSPQQQQQAQGLLREAQQYPLAPLQPQHPWRPQMQPQEPQPKQPPHQPHANQEGAQGHQRQGWSGGSADACAAGELAAEPAAAVGAKRAGEPSELLAGHDRHKVPDAKRAKHAMEGVGVTAPHDPHQPDSQTQRHHGWQQAPRHPSGAGQPKGFQPNLQHADRGQQGVPYQQHQRQHQQQQQQQQQQQNQALHYPEHRKQPQQRQEPPPQQQQLQRGPEVHPQQYQEQQPEPRYQNQGQPQQQKLQQEQQQQLAWTSRGPEHHHAAGPRAQQPPAWRPQQQGYQRGNPQAHPKGPLPPPTGQSSAAVAPQPGPRGPTAPPHPHHQHHYHHQQQLPQQDQQQNYYPQQQQQQQRQQAHDCRNPPPGGGPASLAPPGGPHPGPVGPPPHRPRPISPLAQHRAAFVPAAKPVPVAAGGSRGGPVGPSRTHTPAGARRTEGCRTTPPPSPTGHQAPTDVSRQHPQHQHHREQQQQPPPSPRLFALPTRPDAALALGGGGPEPLSSASASVAPQSPLLHTPGFTVLKTAAQVAAVCEALKAAGGPWGFALDFAEASATPTSVKPGLQLPSVPQVALSRGLLVNSIGLPLHYEDGMDGSGGAAAASADEGAAAASGGGAGGRVEGIALSAHDGCAVYVPLMAAATAGVQMATAAAEAATVLTEVRALLGHTGCIKVTFELKQQLLAVRQALAREAAAATGSSNADPSSCLTAGMLPLDVADPVVDARILLWMLNPDDPVNLPRGKSGKLTVTKGLEERMKQPEVCGSTAHAKAVGVLGCAGTVVRQLPIRQADACRRAAMVRRIFQDKLPRLQAEGLLRPLLEVEMPLVRVLAAMEAGGVALAPQVLRNQRGPLEARLRQLAHKAHVAVGMTFDLNSPKDVSDVLFQHLGLPPPPCAFTSAHQKHPSTKKEVLEELQEATRHPILRPLLDYRSLHKLLTGFVETLYSTAREQWMRQQQGQGERGPVPDAVRLCGSWLQTGTATGRLAMDEPNLQTIPRPVEYSFQLSQESGEPLLLEAPPQEQAGGDVAAEGGGGGQGAGRIVTMHFNLRNAFVAPPGHVILTADYKQIELRLMAHFSGDSALCVLLRNPSQDPFTLLAAQWKRLPAEKVTSELRVQAKRLAYGMLYGMGTSTLASELGVAVHEAAELSENFRRAIPGVERWTKKVVEECRSCGFVSTLLGRRRYFPRINERSTKEARSHRAQAERQAVNSVCQGSAADLVKAAMITLQRRLEAEGLAGRARMVLMVHDELVLEVEAAALPTVAGLVQGVLEGQVALAVPLPVKLSAGPSWGQLQEYEPPRQLLQQQQQQQQ